jgi:hypothetical protein
MGEEVHPEAAATRAAETVSIKETRVVISQPSWFSCRAVIASLPLSARHTIEHEQSLRFAQAAVAANSADLARSMNAA